MKRNWPNSRRSRPGLRAQWEREKSGIDEISQLKKELEATKEAIAKAEREYDLNKAAELKYGRLTELEKKLAALSGGGDGEPRLRGGRPRRHRGHHLQVDGHPGFQAGGGEREKLLKLADILHERVIGQDEAVQAVADAVLGQGSRTPSGPSAHLHVPRPHRRGQDRAVQDPGGKCL